MFRSFIAALIAATAFADGGDVAYDYKKQGADWGKLKDSEDHLAYPDCNLSAQSPIDLADSFGVGNSEIAIEVNSKYEDYTSINMIKSGNNVKVNLGPNADSVGDGTMDLTREDEESLWSPLQFHFHAPSEHTVMGKHMDLEMHIVHLPGADSPHGDKGYAVLGIFFDMEEGGDGENAFLA